MSLRFSILAGVIAVAMACGGATDGGGNDTKATSKTGDGGTSAEGGVSPDGASTTTDEFVPGAPMTVKNGEWTWVDFPDTSCANGTPTGLGLWGGSAKKLFLYLDGGGACWDELTCFQVGTAQNLDGVDEARFRSDLASHDFTNTPLNFGDPANPFKDYNIAYLPYCTGDVHTGDREMTYSSGTIKHFGRRNLKAFLERIVPTFPNLERVVFVGASAGGLGVLANYWRVKDAFGSVRVDMIDDSGPPFAIADNIFFADQANAWDLPGTVPPGCTQCQNPADVLPFYLQKYPDARFSLLEFNRDEVMSGFFLMTSDGFQAKLTKLVADSFTTNPRAQAFILEGNDHPTLLGVNDTSGSPPVSLKSWLGDMISDAPTWKTVTPPAQ